MRNPIQVDIPTAQELAVVRDRTRTTSLVYEYLISTAGLGVAERWLSLLDRTRSENLFSLAVRAMSPTRGWVLSTNAAAERIARRHYEIAPAHIRAISLRAWEAAKIRDERAR